MAEALWGNVYLYNQYVGHLSEDPGRIYKFVYDKTYLQNPFHEISQTLPLREEPYYSPGILHPYFNNLVAEGWLANAQARALDVPVTNRLALLLGFGHDCIGAITLQDPEEKQLKMSLEDRESMAALTSRASLSGVQPKIFLTQKQNSLHVSQYRERSTHIGKLDFGTIPDLVDIEYLSLKMMQNLLPTESIEEIQISTIPELGDSRALIVKRFDRTHEGNLVHFEEFNQLLGQSPEDKYTGAYHAMADFLKSNEKCSPIDIERLFRRILVNLVMGNTDAHFKNFGMLYQNGRLELCPSYDVVASSYYPPYQTIALALGTASNLRITDLRVKHLKVLCQHFGLPLSILDFALGDLEKRFEKTLRGLEQEVCVSETLRSTFINHVRKKWNPIKNLLGKTSSNKPSPAVKN